MEKILNLRSGDIALALLAYNVRLMTMKCCGVFSFSLQRFISWPGDVLVYFSSHAIFVSRRWIYMMSILFIPHLGNCGVFPSLSYSACLTVLYGCSLLFPHTSPAHCSVDVVHCSSPIQCSCHDPGEFWCHHIQCC